MDNVKDNQYYVNKILDNIKFIVEHMEDVSKEQFIENDVLADSMMFRIVQISENANKLSDDYIESHSDFPLNYVRGLRNKLVHDYGIIDLNIIYDILKSDIPELYRLISSQD